MMTLPQRIAVALLACLATPVSLALGADRAREADPAPAAPALATVEPFRISRVAAQGAGLSAEVLDLALTATRCGMANGDFVDPRTLTVIDYSRPSLEPRLWVFDLESGAMLFRELVAHGANTGDNMARYFSDTPNSRQTSIGLFVARETYVGSNGYSMRMDGLEPGFNSRARERAIVMHGAPYVDGQVAARQGRLGRSWGCPALREAVARKIIDTVRDGGIVFSYYPDAEWLTTSRFLNCDGNAPARATLASTATGS